MTHRSQPYIRPLISSESAKPVIIRTNLRAIRPTLDRLELDRLHAAPRLKAARRFCQLLAGGWGQAEAAKLAGGEAVRADRRGRGPMGTAGGGMRWRRPALHVLNSTRGPTDG